MYDGEWVYGCPLVVDTDKRKVAMIVTLHEAYPDTLAKVTTSVDFNSLGQFTGMLDKNGLEIYEGDIVRHDENSEYFEVEYDAPEFRYKENTFGFRFMVYTPELITVVGNIHDNPELINKRTND